MEFGVLGPLRVLDRGVDVAPTAPKQRQLLALLLLNANRIVPISTVVEELWSHTPPPTATAAIHTYVKQLRRTMRRRLSGDGTAPCRLVTRAQGYQLHVQPGEMDLDVFLDRMRVATQSLTRHDYARAAHQLRAALTIWRDHALADVLTGSVLQPATAAIERARLDAVIRRIDADLQLGWHHELLGELSRLVHSNPDNEDLAAHLMLALYRSGRQADALGEFHRLRGVLSVEHASAPSSRVNELYTDILNAHPKLETSPRANARTALDLADPELRCAA